MSYDVQGDLPSVGLGMRCDAIGGRIKSKRKG